MIHDPTEGMRDIVLHGNQAENLGIGIWTTITDYMILNPAA